MTPREIIDRFSSALLRDERILSVSERGLLASLLQHTKTPQTTPENPAVAEAITRAVGEIVAERALGVIRESLTHQLLLQDLDVLSGFSERILPGIRAGSPPNTPPSPSPGENQPRPPGTSPPPIRAGSPPNTPPSPSPGENQPRPPGTSPPPIALAGRKSQPKANGVAVLEAPDYLSAQFAVLDEFLSLDELNALRQFVLAQQSHFEISEVISPGVTGGAIDFDCRRSRVLMDLGGHEEAIKNRLPHCLPRILERWGRDPFPISQIEAQATASNHADFFHCHVDNGAESVASREITFVYFFHREPKPFSGGELRIYDSRRERDNFVPSANYRTIVPEQNQLILFASGLSHEITPVDCPSGQFADSRFTINGWIHR
jgi:Rps23 Pro-64 3,4-dihydroxylase Tpa1-like proline 4-hydroxylase